MKLCSEKRILLGAALPLLLVIGAGCTKTPEAPTTMSASDPQLTNSRITAIQNDPQMSAAEKEKAIAVLKQRQGSDSSSSTP